MWTMTDPKSMSTQCDAAVPSRPIGFCFSSRSDGDDAVGDRLELPFGAAGADHEVVGQRRQGRELEQHDVGRLLVLGQLDDAAGEVKRGAVAGRGGGRVAVRQAVGAGHARFRGDGAGKRGFGHDRSILRCSV